MSCATIQRGGKITKSTLAVPGTSDGEVSTVNGELEIGDDVVIARTASTVNGSIELGKRTRVGGDVSTVSGEIELDGAEVGGKVTTRNGDIELLDGARIRGGIHIKWPDY